MIYNFINVKKYIPRICAETVYDIDYDKLYSEGKRFILFDLDNTLLPYDVAYADEKLKTFFVKLQDMGFKVIIFSNNSGKRVSIFCDDVNLEYITSAKKPLKTGFKKAMKLINCRNKSEMIAVGDQLLTDILGANRFGIDCALVKTIKKSSQKWYTRLNRLSEKSVLKRVKKYDSLKYSEIEAVYER